MAGRGKDGESRSRIAASPDDIRLFSRALELLSSTHPDSDAELLELVKQAKRDVDQDVAAPKTGLHSTNSSNEAVVPNSSLSVVGMSAGNPNHSQTIKTGCNKSLAEKKKKKKRKAGRL